MKNLLKMKLKDRLGIALSIVLVLSTILLVIDLQLDLGYSGAHIYGDTRPGVVKTVSRRSRLLAVLLNNDVVADVSSTEDFWIKRAAQEPDIYSKISKDDRFDDLYAIVSKAQESNANLMSTDEIVEQATSSSSTSSESSNPIMGKLLNFKMSKKPSNLEKFHYNISRNEMYSEQNADTIAALLHDMATMKLRRVIQKDGGTQLKLTLQFDKDIKALFKPMRFARHKQTLPNHYYFSDYERHTAEIAAFHLDRLLGFRRAMPVIGRSLNVTSEIVNLADDELKHTSFISPVGNQCFYGKCSYYCDSNHAICGRPDMLEGSLAAFLPLHDGASRKVWRHPWRRSYNKKKFADWELDNEYCVTVRNMAEFEQGRRLFDIMDMSVFDFLSGNMDRHHYETFDVFGNDTFTIHLDHGRAFGKAFHDEISCLAPIKQCCIIRKSTLKTLLEFHRGPKPLSKLMEEAMAYDPIAPVLWQPHLTALDRRVVTILSEIRNCLQNAALTNDVIVSNEKGFY